MLALKIFLIQIRKVINPCLSYRVWPFILMLYTIQDSFSQTYNFQLLRPNSLNSFLTMWRSSDGTIYCTTSSDIEYSLNHGASWLRKKLPTGFWLYDGAAGHSSLIVLNDKYSGTLIVSENNGSTFKPSVKVHSAAHLLEIDKANRIIVADTASSGKLLFSINLGASYDSIFAGSYISGVGTLDTNIFIALSKKGVYAFNVHKKLLTRIFADTVFDFRFASGSQQALYAYDINTILKFTPSTGWKRFSSGKELKYFYVDSLDRWFTYDDEYFGTIDNNLFESLDSGATWIHRGPTSGDGLFYMDNYLYSLSNQWGVLRSDISVKPPTKHFLNLASGNKWQFRKSDIYFDHLNNRTTYRFSLVEYEIAKDTIINGRSYYPSIFFAPHFGRVDTVTKNILINFAGAEYLFFDYGIIPYQAYYHYDPKLGEGWIDTDFSLEEFNGRLMETRSYGQASGNMTTKISEYSFIDSIGFYSKYYASGDRFFGVGEKYELLSARIKYDNYKTFNNGQKPVITFTPITKTGYQNFTATATVTHGNNSINYGAEDIGIIYIEKVMCFYYYSRDSIKAKSGFFKEDSIALTPVGAPYWKYYQLNLPLNLNLLQPDGKLYYRFVATDKALDPNNSRNPVSGYHTLIYDPALGNEEKENVAEFKLFPCFPHPFSSLTKINFSLPKASEARFEVYSILGEKLLELSKNQYEKGMNQQVLNAARLSSGVYILKLIAGENSEFQKILIVK